ncbi:Uncharacterized protein QTN25_008842 [Entamoeba marina]
MKRHWMGGERGIAKKKKELHFEMQQNAFKKYQAEALLKKPHYNKVLTQDIVALIGSLDLNEIEKTLGDSGIKFEEKDVAPLLGKIIQDSTLTETEYDLITKENSSSKTEIEQPILFTNNQNDMIREEDDDEVMLEEDDFFC